MTGTEGALYSPASHSDQDSRNLSSAEALNFRLCARIRQTRRLTEFRTGHHVATPPSLRNNDWTKILGWPGYRVYRSEIDEQEKKLKLWVRRKANKLVCSACGRVVSEIAEVYEREVRDLPCFEYRTTVTVELYRIRCPDCGVKTE